MFDEAGDVALVLDNQNAVLGHGLPVSGSWSLEPHRFTFRARIEAVKCG
jgi:hypothetical protein